MKKIILKIGVVLGIILCGIWFFSNLIIHNPKKEECAIIKTQITAVYEGTTFDINFRDINGKMYYINRGTEQGLEIKSLRNKVQNKTVTLHLPKVIYGVTNHISQLTVNDSVLFTEF